MTFGYRANFAPKKMPEANCLVSSTGVFLVVLGAVFLSAFVCGARWAFSEESCLTHSLKSQLQAVKAQLSKAQKDLDKAKTDATDATNTEKKLKEGRLLLHSSTEEAKILRLRLDRLQAKHNSNLANLEKTLADERASHTALTLSLNNELKANKAIISSQISTISSQAGQLSSLKAAISSQLEQLTTIQATIIARAEELEVTKANLRSQASQLYANKRTITAQAQDLIVAKAKIEYQARSATYLQREIRFQKLMAQAWKAVHADEVKELRKRISEGEEQKKELKVKIGELEEVIWILGGKGLQPWNGGEDEAEWDEDRGFVKRKEEEEESGSEAGTLDSDGELEDWDQGYDCDGESEGDEGWTSEDGDDEEFDEREGEEDLVLV